MKDLVCVDSMLCIWAVKRISSPGQEAMIPLAASLLDKLTKDKKEILLPAPVVMELLAPVDDPDDYNSIITSLNTDFRVGALDVKAAAISAKIWNTVRTDWKDIYNSGEAGARNRFKFDLMVLGIAVSNKVECLYTADDNLCALASTQGMPTHNLIKQGIPSQGIQYPLLLPR
jgi:hypothetical protein